MVTPDSASPSVETTPLDRLNRALAEIDNAELAAKADAIVTAMCHGDRWRMSIPVHRDDSDVVLSELVRRFRLHALGSTVPAANYVRPSVETTRANYVRVLAKCPVCNGAGTTSRPPWVPGDSTSWVTSDTAAYPCLACDAKGWIDPPQPASIVTVYNPNAEELAAARLSVRSMDAQLTSLSEKCAAIELAHSTLRTAVREYVEECDAETPKGLSDDEWGAWMDANLERADSAFARLRLLVEEAK